MKTEERPRKAKRLPRVRRGNGNKKKGWGQFGKTVVNISKKGSREQPNQKKSLG